MAFSVVGLLSIVFFYVLILFVGMWAARKGSADDGADSVMLAGRNIGVLVRPLLSFILSNNRSIN